ncbi:MAG: proton-conducting transporter membrane subunit [Candidatus Omnitrophota bacterium]|nr:proton-conducting transporter membrane subunit [Candidatus Omnitrophota bacterium]
MNPNSIIPYLVIAPLAAAFLIIIFGKIARPAGSIIACVASALSFAVSLALSLSIIKYGVLIHKVGGWMPPAGIPMVVDSYSALILLIANFIAMLITLYSVSYVKIYTDTWKYFTLLMLTLAGVNGVAVSGDIFNMFVYLEIASLATYALVAFGNEAEALEASFKYAVMSSVASTFMLIGIAFLYNYTSTLNMAYIGRFIAGNPASKVLSFVSVLFLAGFGLKAALAPFHAWLPDAYTKAPAPIPAISSGVLIKVLGVYALTRLFFNVFGMTKPVSYILIFFAVISMLGGSILAFGQSNIRRLLGYSSISQIGYIVLGFAIGTPLAIMGSLFHIFNHSAAKALLFMGAGSMEQTFGTQEIKKISGVISKMPVTGYTSLIGALSICGIPPLGGFWSKLIIIFACIQAGYIGLAFIAAFVSILTLAYYFKAYAPMLFGPKEDTPDLSRKTGTKFLMGVPMVILAVVSAGSVVFLVPGFMNILMRLATIAVINGTAYVNIVLGSLK